MNIYICVYAYRKRVLNENKTKVDNQEFKARKRPCSWEGWRFLLFVQVRQRSHTWRWRRHRRLSTSNSFIETKFSECFLDHASWSKIISYPTRATRGQVVSFWLKRQLQRQRRFTEINFAWISHKFRIHMRIHARDSSLNVLKYKSESYEGENSPLV